MLAAGMKAPDFELAGEDRKPVRLSALLSGGPVLVAFFKVSCPVCQYTFPFLERLAGAAAVLGISQDKAAATADFRRAFGITFPIVFDAAPAYSVSNAFGITSVPSLFLVGEDGTVAVSGSGFSRADLETIGSGLGTPPFREGERVPEFRPG